MALEPLPCGFDRFIDLRDGGFPAEFPLDLGDVGIQFGWIARSAFSFIDAKVDSGDTLG